MADEEASFTFNSAERIARTVKEVERSGYDPKQERAGSTGANGTPTQRVKVSGAYNATRKQYPGKYQYATLNGSNATVWNNLTAETQDCWIESGGDNLSVSTPDILPAVLINFTAGEFPVFLASMSASNIIDITCVDGELVITRA